MFDQWVKVSSDELKEVLPDPYVELEQGKWTVRIGTKLGPSPHFVKIAIDPVSGSVIDIEITDTLS